MKCFVRTGYSSNIALTTKVDVREKFAVFAQTAKVFPTNVQLSKNFLKHFPYR